ncbi:hypothetical protein TZ03_24885 [Pseudomonas sp. 10-1B]|uniref:hypothetical protein n=1 Tax=Pseudomonas TaxID=286 RepID=UPI00061E696A|nr:hypothetical protein [Pseudomonas sp. 10-1B]KIY38022.1 hypothetical protein TZ03_24885 [Pseudomonas sp. 10-1B]
MLQDDREYLELEQLQIENRKLRAETHKLVAETRKLGREMFWYPLGVGAAIVTTIAGVMALANKL